VLVVASVHEEPTVVNSRRQTASAPDREITHRGCSIRQAMCLLTAFTYHHLYDTLRALVAVCALALSLRGPLRWGLLVALVSIDWLAATSVVGRITAHSSDVVWFVRRGVVRLPFEADFRTVHHDPHRSGAKDSSLAVPITQRRRHACSRRR
jgi:hypothetical protein